MNNEKMKQICKELAVAAFEKCIRDPEISPTDVAQILSASCALAINQVQHGLINSHSLPPEERAALCTKLTKACVDTILRSSRANGIVIHYVDDGRFLMSNDNIQMN